MKKRRRLLLITCVIIGFTMLTLTPASAFGGHRHYYGPHAYWGGALFGLGILTAALVTNSLLDHPEPVTVYRPAPVVALPPSTVVEQRVLPPVVRLPSPATGKATVTAVLLNVRSGLGDPWERTGLVLCEAFGRTLRLGDDRICSPSVRAGRWLMEIVFRLEVTQRKVSDGRELCASLSRLPHDGRPALRVSFQQQGDS